MSAITIINVFDCINCTTYTYDQYFTDTRNGPASIQAIDSAVSCINSMSNYWVQQHGGEYAGFVDSEEGYVVKNAQGEVAMIYYTQELTFFVDENKADHIV